MSFQLSVGSFQFEESEGQKLAERGRASVPMRITFTKGRDTAGEHSLNFVHSRMQRLELLRREKIQIFGERNEIFQLAGRSPRDVKRLTQFGICSSLAPLGDVCANREGSSSHLTGESKHFLPGKNSGDVIQAHGQSMAFLPHQQFGVVLHDCPATESTFCVYYCRVLCYLFTSHCKLTTDNCQLFRGVGHAR
jgi:hypothetical protein